jgi:hypothetical protein
MSQADLPAPSRFYCLAQDEIHGPFDVVDLAAQLRYGTINSDSQVCPEGAEVWVRFRELPEFVIARDMSIETIALRLEEREKTGRDPSATEGEPAQARPSRVDYFWMSSAAIVLAACAGLVIRAAQPIETQPSTFAAPWFETKGLHFSIECPVVMQHGYLGDGVLGDSYQGYIDGAQFGMRGGYLAGYQQDRIEREVHHLLSHQTDRTEARGGNRLRR